MNSKIDDTTIHTVDTDGNKLKLTIKNIGHKILQEAQMIYNLKITSLIQQSVSENIKFMSRQQLEQYLNDTGVWTDKEAKAFLQLQLQLRAMELKLKTGGIKVSEAKKIALDMKMKRALLLALYSRRLQFDEITMESMAENQKFKFLIVRCTVDATTNELFFDNIADYETREQEQASIDVATAMASSMYGYDMSTESNLTENMWLKQFNFADDKGRLINSNGKLIDLDGNLIDEDGRFIDENNNFIDSQGRTIDRDGNFTIKTKPFIDDITDKPIKNNKNRKYNKKSKAVM